MKRFSIALASLSLAVTVLIPTVGQAATLAVPKTPWPTCSTTQLTWCVSAVSIQAPGQAPLTLTWVPSGTPSVTTTSSTTTTITGSATTTTTAPTSSTTTTSPPSSLASQGTTAFPGYWTSASWPDSSLGFGGLYIQAMAANVFSNYMLFNVLPAIQDSSSNNVFIADATGTNNAASLSPDDIITVSLETGTANAGVSLAIANNFSDTVGSDANGTNLTFTATPVPVGVASDTNQCTGEAGVAVAATTELQVIVAPTNDPTSGFGVDGVSGKMYVESNGACSLSTPVWDATTSTLQWTVAAPHFLPDGVTVNQGFYQAMIPGADAELLWGLTNINQAASALTISETSSGGAANNVAISSISVRNGNIIISSTGFKFSSPTFKLAKNPHYKTKTAISCIKGKTVKKVGGVLPKCPGGYKLLQRITCVKGKIVKAETGVSPRCPTGYKRKS